MKIIVTGGAGFIGSHVVDALINLDHKVIVIDNLSTGKEKNINSKAVFYNVDIRDKKRIEDIFTKEKPDYVNHHAAHINVTKSVQIPQEDAEINILGSLNLIEASRKIGLKKFVYISTGGATYGEPKYIPAKEDHPINPLAPYGVSKHTVEHYLYLYSKNYGLNYTTLRYPNVYGPRQDPKGEAGVIAIFSLQMLKGIQPTLFGDGTKTRDYVYVDDIVQANILALNHGDNDIFNLGWGKGIQDKEIFHAVKHALGISVEPQYLNKRLGELDHIALDASHAIELLEWIPCISLEDGIQRATSYYKENRLKYCTR